MHYRNQEEECDISGCNCKAEYYDDMGNAMCEDCVEQQIENEDYCWDDFEVI